MLTPPFPHPQGQELDLHKVFLEVVERGGYERVTCLKLWRDVCRALVSDLTGQTSASYNMRINYEKCLLDFEVYMTSGQYAEDLGNGAGWGRGTEELRVGVGGGTGGGHRGPGDWSGRGHGAGGTDDLGSGEGCVWGGYGGPREWCGGP